MEQGGLNDSKKSVTYQTVTQKTKCGGSVKVNGLLKVTPY